MKRFFAVFFLLLLAFTSPALAKKEKPTAEDAYDRVIRTGVLRCGYMPWPPFFDLDPNTGEISGISKEASDAAARLANIKLEYVQITNGQQIQDLASGKIDAVCGDGPWVISTIRFLDYSTAYVHAAVFVYGRADETRISSFDDLNKPDITFVGIDSDLSVDLVLNHFPQARLNTLAAISDPSQMLVDVSTNKADATILDPLSVSVFEASNPGKVKILSDKPVGVYGAGFSVRKGDVKLLQTLNQAVEAAINLGLIDPIIRKYDPNGEWFYLPNPAWKKP